LVEIHRDEEADEQREDDCSSHSTILSLDGLEKPTIPRSALDLAAPRSQKSLRVQLSNGVARTESQSFVFPASGAS
jgi:hypothetical protein